MKIVPVIDLKGGVVVHARRGRRDEYAPLRSPLVDGCEPVAVARALCAICRTTTLYVADLDALAGAPVDEATLAAVAAESRSRGSTPAPPLPSAAAALHRAGAARNVLGTESLEPERAPVKPPVTPPLVLEHRPARRPADLARPGARRPSARGRSAPRASSETSTSSS